ncbi:KR domain-containing protein [Streptacidiphilus sp. 4-A2]|nr:KR domain-containing protein [Streptacidiphilus sp. 4-A2]
MGGHLRRGRHRPAGAADQSGPGAELGPGPGRGAGAPRPLGRAGRPARRTGRAAAGRLAAVLAGCGEDQVAIRADGIRGRRLLRAPKAVGGEPWTRAAACWSPAAPARSAAMWPAGWPGAARPGWCCSAAPVRPRPGAALAAELAACGTAVEVLAGDSGQRSQLTALLARIAATGPALTGVMHTAGVVDNGVLDRLDPARLGAVLAAKAGSAALLDELTAGLELDAFVLFSSASATFGAGGQGNYAAANAYLDALAEHRRARAWWRCRWPGPVGGRRRRPGQRGHPAAAQPQPLGGADGAAVRGPGSRRRAQQPRARPRARPRRRADRRRADRDGHRLGPDRVRRWRERDAAGALPA